MNPSILALAALAITGCATMPRSAAGVEDVRVMSFNIRVDVASDGEDAWPNRIDAVAETIREADVIGVQEATAAMLDDLDAHLQATFARVGIGRDADGGGEQSAILYRPDRFEVIESGTFWLSPTPEVAGSQGWDAALPRIATWANLRDRQRDAAFVVVNTHFDHVGETARLQSARLVAERALDLADGLPLIVTGDMNATDDSPPYLALADVLRDARTVSRTPPTGTASTWNAFGRATDARRIDYVFVAGPVQVLQTATLDRTIGDVLGTDNSRVPSDHHAVTATVSF